MSEHIPTQPVKDTVPKVANAVAVGEDLVFQRRWWRFERAIWILFAVVVLLDLLGVFGRGPLANAHLDTPDGAMHLDYERVQRFSTPSILTVHFGPGAVHDGTIQLWASDSVVTRLGAQRVSPQPEHSLTLDAGVLYTFASGEHPDSVAFALQPSEAGPAEFELRLAPGGNMGQPMDTLGARVFVMP